jgi:tetratricopeptide (TPR) repeat protein
LTAEELFARGITLADQGQLVRAEQYLSLAVARGYREERALPVLLKVCLAASRLRSALNYAEPYLARHPRDWKLRYLAASLYIGLEQPERARQELERVVTNEPAHAAAHYLLAVLMRDSFSNVRAAVEHFQAYLKLEPRGDHAAEITGWLLENAASDERPENIQYETRPNPKGRFL